MSGTEVHGDVQMAGALARLALCDWEGLRALRHPGLIEGRMSVMVVERLRGGQVYLATPYSRHVTVDGVFCDYKSGFMGGVAADWARRLAVAGVSAVSPVVLAVAMLREDLECGLRPLDHVFWAHWCQPLLLASRTVAVPMIEGWDSSRGIWAEVIWALVANRPVVLINNQEQGDV